MRGGGERKSFNFIKGYALKADIKKYFENVDQEILLSLIKKRIKDEKLVILIEMILYNFDSRVSGKGMPLGNLTSQFFANIYLNELDQFVKNNLKAKFYMRYVDDFIILHRSKKVLQIYESRINEFLINNLKLELHPDKSKIIMLSSGINFLGFRVFYHHKLLRKKAPSRINSRIEEWKEMYDMGLIQREEVLHRLSGWMAYAVNGNTYYLRKKLMVKFNRYFPPKDKN